jgi:tyrosine-protein kinase Etk/Wzc
MGRRTLVIDGDVRRGTLHKVLGKDRKPGLTDLLAGNVTAEAAFRDTEHQLLDFIPCGSRFQDGPELLSSPEMRRFIADMRSRYQVILIDSPPLGATVDPFVLATISGTMLVVLRNGVTDREIAGSRLTTAGRLPIRVLGAILNDVRPSGFYRYYAYLPGYGVSDEGPPTEDRLIGAGT